MNKIDDSWRDNWVKEQAKEQRWYQRRSVSRTLLRLRDVLLRADDEEAGRILATITMNAHYRGYRKACLEQNQEKRCRICQVTREHGIEGLVVEIQRTLDAEDDVTTH